jgi:hypothetical protein
MVKHLSFSDWFKIEDYKKYDASTSLGVYVLAHFDEEPCSSNELPSDKISARGNCQGA